jgi:hypothetical protein
MLLGNMKTHPPEVKIEPRKKTAEQISSSGGGRCHGIPGAGQATT